MQDYEFLRLESRPDGVYFTQFSGDRERIVVQARRTRRPTATTRSSRSRTPADAFPARLIYRRGTEGWLYADDRRNAERQRPEGDLSVAPHRLRKRRTRSADKRMTQSRHRQPSARSAALVNFERMLAAGKDSALLRFSIGNEYAKADAVGARRRSARARRRARIRSTRRRGSSTRARCRKPQPREALAAYRKGIDVAKRKGDRQAEKEMTVFARRIERALAGLTLAARRTGCGRAADRSAPSCATPRLASASARSLPGVSAWPLHPVPADVGAVATSASSSRHRSAFLTGLRSRGLPAVLLPAVDPALDAVASRTANRCRARRRSARFSASSARMTAVSSIRLLVVCGSPPKSSFSCRRQISSAPQPPGPGIAFARAVGVDRHDARSRARARSCDAVAGCVDALSRRARAGASAFLRRSRRSHAGVITRMPSTFLVARR